MGLLLRYAEASLEKREAEIEYGNMDMSRIMRLMHLEYRIDLVFVFLTLGSLLYTVSTRNLDLVGISILGFCKERTEEVSIARSSLFPNNIELLGRSHLELRIHAVQRLIISLDINHRACLERCLYLQYRLGYCIKYIR